jgi:hypothetical protein
MIIMLAARASRAWWVLWKPFWTWTPLVLAVRIQLAVVVLALVPALVRADPRSGSELSVIASGLVVYGVVAQLRRKYRLRRFTPWEDRRN